MILSMDFKELVAACESAFARNDLRALAVALDALQLRWPPDPAMQLGELATLAGLFIDAGAALRLQIVVQRGQQILADNWDRLEPSYGSAQLNYNTGNAYKALYDIERVDAGWRFSIASAVLVLKAKASYWRALSEAKPEKITPEQLTNLGNALDACGRVIDALHYYDRALSVDARFGMAQVNRGLALLYLNRVSGSYSIKLMHEIYRSLLAGATADSTEPHARAEAKRHAELVAQAIRGHGHNPEEDQHSVRQDEEERARHDPYWQWCLKHSLALSEHSLYCQCVGARRDDLSIMTPGGRLSGADVPNMELLLNRIKSEYCLSRALLFQSAADGGSLKWNVGPFEGTFTDLFDDEVTGIEPELLRTSFRLCFGILDRIARGICGFLTLATDRENLYFDSFWRAGGRDNTRWDTLSTLSDPSIVALYSLAGDLNERAGGEWSRLKRYRNLFEHELCLVRYDSTSRDVPPWMAQTKFASISEGQLRSDAMDMLRFTRSAIFYFTFFIRSKSRESDERREAVVVTFPKKPIGKE